MCGINPLIAINLLPIPIESKASYEAEERAKEMKKLYEQIGAHIEKENATHKPRANKHRKHMEFSPSDLV